MNYTEYTLLFEQILTAEAPAAPYDNPDYFNYTKLNESRMKRWTKTMVLEDELIQLLEKLSVRQHWIIITEPWCGDASHIVPFLVRMAELSPAITYELQLRDTAPFLIDSYLTNGGKAIPKLVSRDENGTDLFTWGPRPAGAQSLMNRLKEENAEFERIKIELQNWYNANKGKEIQEELKKMLQ
ncbi:thioredoxin family protein [Crocinitomicaceae bacterium CZZ-1]|uniref:Thioredoxin family protein n=1 Tax=Taishania pollutisoli TaxID=2766479 RepID=A0A8J6TY78_9FLAO|nr:thioredoxin family protein [Taishania pollutisoli]MBC9813616.1 thioredoxin family protein [Taishania pollutisoli]NGF75606.1 thioredoxin family protein [Fluviicola sp. SGL-29]